MSIEVSTVVVPRVEPRPIAAEPPPQNPYMAPNGRNNMHNDAFMSDTYGWAGPLGGTLVVSYQSLGGEGASITYDPKGRLVTVCIGPDSRRLLLLDPGTLDVLAAMDLPSGKGGSTGFGGGGYIYLNERNQAVLPTANQQIWVVAVPEGSEGFRVVRVHDLTGSIGDTNASILSALPDWSGRLWWITDSGVVGYIDPDSGACWTLTLDAPQTIGNSFAVDETGGVFIASDYALYRFDVPATGTRPQVTWCYSYDRGLGQKTGQQSWGTGTTPTLVGTAPGESYCGIADNAYPQMHVVVYRREKDVPGNRVVAQVPVFPKGHSDTENSLIGCTGSFFVENNYGYSNGVSTRPVVPGMARVRYDNRPCPGTVAWENEHVTVPSVVSKLSLATGLLYTYSLKIEDGRHDWFLTAVEAETGSIAWSAKVGSGILFDNHYSALSIAPDGTVYIPTALGMVMIREA
ncbi:hypothetical protein [Nitrospirillum sp. BR 11828]|uniref:hypothetical protein n=1 Tax=Nitrospirillum sp. BR 11828 TaxID=3104325 RepID=UPI002ACA1895|nr:hypothetical protein [Nitrospirillum sp. BR 11828]MDZ5646958.1 hypothetical protein [Nitrospirillum sp. BR 11828]